MKKFKNLLLYLALIVILYGCGANNSSNPPEPKDSYQKIEVNQVPNGERIFFVKINPKKIWLFTDSVDVSMGDIYSMSPTGTDVIRHTNLSQFFFLTDKPQLSNDGSTLTFISNFCSWRSAFYTDVFRWDLSSNVVIRVSGDERPFPPERTAKLEVLTLESNGSSARISAKGCLNWSHPKDLVTTDSGNYYRTILTVPAGENIWVKAEHSRDKSDLAFVVCPQNEVTYIGLSTERATGVACESAFPSSNGNNIVGMLNGKIAMWENNRLVWEKNIGGQIIGLSADPAFSRDDSKIALCYGKGSYANTLAILSPPDNTEAPNIILDEPLIGNKQICLSPSWSPDNTKIAFAYGIIGGTGNTANIFTINPDGSRMTQLTNYSNYFAAVNPCFSPDGTMIIFTLLKCKNILLNDIMDFMNRDNIESANLYVIPVTGGQPTPLTTDGISYNACWGIVRKK